MGARLSMGDCPKVDAMQDLDVRKFTGEWYMVETFSTSNKCMTMSFNQTSDTTLSLIEGREFQVVKALSIDHVFNYEGKLTIVNTNNPGKMSLWWPGHLSNDITFTVVDTDYSQYALTFECQKMWIMSRTTAAILSRERTLDAAIINKLKNTLEAFGIDRTEFYPMPQTNCIKPDEADLQINFDGESLGLLPDDIASDAEMVADHVPQELLDAYNRETENNEIFP